MKKLFTGTCIGLIISINIMANGIPDGGQVKGRIFDQKSNQPIEFATIALFNAMDSTLVKGTITDTNGEFSASQIAEGRYYIKVRFVGYEEMHYGDLVIDNSNRNVDLGEVYLEASAQNLEEVVITNERNPVEFQIDKKIVSVGEQMTASSLSAPG